MMYFFAGATSQTGIAVLERLVSHVGAENVNCLVRPTSITKPLQALGVKLHVGNVTQPDTFKSLLGSNVTYLDMTHPKHYHISLQAITGAGVRRAYFVTTTGIFSKYNQCSEIYKVNEARIRDSGIVYTILRPTMIYGSAQDKNMNRLIRFLDRYPIFPLFGNGQNLMQPVYVDDLADGIAAAIIKPNTEYQEYNLAGFQAITYLEVIDTILRQLNRQVLKIKININLAATIANYAQHLPGFPITGEQVLRLQENKDFNISKANSELGYSPRSFEKGIKSEINAMRLAGIIRA
ncbi:MAG: NAD-dependent epimerase/dehydratase family protein [Coleofasciculaceae cyanobacterium]